MLVDAEAKVAGLREVLPPELVLLDLLKATDESGMGQCMAGGMRLNEARGWLNRARGAKQGLTRTMARCGGKMRAKGH